jgi:hypothetical protein
LIKILDYTKNPRSLVDQLVTLFTIGDIKGFNLSEYLAVTIADNNTIPIYDTNTSFTRRILFALENATDAIL